VAAPVVIVGAGQAGLQTAESLRAEGYAGEVLMIGDEPRPPYHRPPLSKAYLLGEFAEAQLAIRAPEALARKNITLLSGVAVTAIDRAAKQVRLSDGRAIDYAGLCLATGSRPRPLPVPGADLANVFPLRTLADTQAVAALLASEQHVAVIGGGFIGLEFAAVARKLGKQVVVLEAAERLMPRAVTPLLSDFYRQLHERHGVGVELNAQVAEIVGSGGRAVAVRTADGREFSAGLIVVGIGILPNMELAQQAGIECDRGIVVDGCSRTSDPSIAAAGDCTARRRPDNSLLRLESVQNAIEQGKSAAAALMGKERPFTASPWFWSDQYDIKLQMVGLAAGHDRTVLRGDPATQSFSAFHYRGDELVAVDSVNRPQDHLPARKLLDLGISPTTEQARSPDFTLTRIFHQTGPNMTVCRIQ
jgi:3-phenylpropionate/trans-cinnamate dioxygenase ferredoxin reductase subunit